MKIAVTSTGPTLEDQVEARFGRCSYFLVIDPDSLAFEPIQNPNIAAGGGAGIQSAQLLANKDVTAVLTGNCGPNAFQTFGAAGIQVITGVTGRVQDAVQRYRSGALAGTSGPSVQSHFGMGMGGGRGAGRGIGMGRSMGMGGGKGMRSGRGRGATVWTGGEDADPAAGDWSKSPGADAEKSETAMLKEQAEALKKQLEKIADRLKKLEGEQE